jgi:hypothetical protein
MTGSEIVGGEEKNLYIFVLLTSKAVARRDNWGGGGGGGLYSYIHVHIPIK